MKAQLLKCFLLILLFISTSSSDNNSRHKKFLKQHVIDNMAENDCTHVIKARGIKDGNNGNCKRTNTFIVGSKVKVNMVCTTEGTPWNNINLRKSVYRFQQVICRWNQNSEWPNCKYTGSDCYSYAVLACDNNNLPVHYERACVY